MALVVPRRFNATTSSIAYTAATSQGVTAQTNWIKCSVYGAGEATTGGYILNAYDSGNRNGLAIRYRSDTGHIGVIADSGGAANVPGSNSSVTVTAGQIKKLFVTWTGGVNSSDLFIYEADNEAPLTSTTTASTNGSGSPISAGAAVTLVIGNNPAGTRTFNGTIFEIGRWSRVLSYEERVAVERRGAAAVPVGLIFDWHDGKDWGPFRLQAPTLTDITTGPPSFFSNLASYADEDAIASDFAGVSSSVKAIYGLDYASVKTVNGLAIASVKTVGGLA